MPRKQLEDLAVKLGELRNTILARARQSTFENDEGDYEEAIIRIQKEISNFTLMVRQDKMREMKRVRR